MFISFLCCFAFRFSFSQLFERPGVAKRSHSTSEVRGGSWEELPHTPMPKARGGGLEEQTHIQGAMAARAQEGLEELSNMEGQEGWWWGDTPHPSKEPQLHFAGVAVKRYPMPKVREIQVRR